MPAPANPLARDVYVYQFKVDGYPFYVGIGRSKRGPDRERYVRSLLSSRNATKLAKSTLHVRIIAALIQRNKTVEYSRTRRLMTRDEALTLERKKIAELIRNGFFLTNWRRNPHRHKDLHKALRVILSKQKVQVSA
jgi:hypothetical protein